MLSTPTIKSLSRTPWLIKCFRSLSNVKGSSGTNSPSTTGTNVNSRTFVTISLVRVTLKLAWKSRSALTSLRHVTSRARVLTSLVSPRNGQPTLAATSLNTERGSRWMAQIDVTEPLSMMARWNRPGRRQKVRGVIFRPINRIKIVSSGSRHKNKVVISGSRHLDTLRRLRIVDLSKGILSLF